MNQTEDFNQYRSRMNSRLLETGDKIIRRIFNLDTNAYEEGHLDKRTKELIGLACSLVLRCDDCVKYHLGKCFDLKIDTKQVVETMSVTTLIGGTIVIPHLRRGMDYWDELNKHVSERS
ncbi:MAG: carboxymuconolactone decarboxylase family protein [Cyclobacteriaceae bacterium]|nr:carboxymuconolactone decarboxylase family protein [Cyclobacteriaceae bacterium]